MVVFITLFSYSVKAQVIHVRGVVVDSATQQPLFKTTVVRLSDNAVFLTDSLGRFDITCTRNDAVRLSYVGYKTLRLIVANVPDSVAGHKKFLRIEMPVDKQALQQIVIRGQKPEQVDSVYYTKALKPIEASLLESPITAIYAEFSKKEREKKQLQEILQARYVDDLFRYRMPTSRLANITGDPSFTPDMLRRFCPPSEYFLLHASDYELYNYAKTCYRQYGVRR